MPHIPYGPMDPVALLLVVVLWDLGHKAAAWSPQVPTTHIDRYLHNMYSLPYGSPHRRINKDSKKKTTWSLLLDTEIVLQHGRIFSYAHWMLWMNSYYYYMEFMFLLSWNLPRNTSSSRPTINSINFIHSRNTYNHWALGRKGGWLTKPVANCKLVICHWSAKWSVYQGVCKIFFKYMTLVYLFKNNLCPPPLPLLFN